MAKEIDINKSTLIWTAVVVAITTTIIDKLFYVINKSVNADAFASAKGYFSVSQADYFPLLYLIVVFFATLITVWIYSLLLHRMPQSWIMKGLIVGLVLFIIGDLAHIIEAGFTTQLPGAAARGMAFMALVSSLINGCVLSYFYRWISGEKKSAK